jgi:small-conductance mechanosensitive channel
MNSFLARFGLGEPEWLDPALGASIFGASIVLAFIFNNLLIPIILRFTKWTPSDLDTRLVRASRLPLGLGIVTLGTYLAFAVPFDLSGGQREVLNTVGGLLAILLGVSGLASVISTGFAWYLESLTSRPRTGIDIRFLPLARRISVALIYGFGAILALDQLDVNINPLIAGLGLGGLAVALAIQPTLTNLFAGTYVMTEGVVTPGDYIELEGGIAGYVIDVGWRSTRIRTWQNNLVVVPNSRFAETIITNYQQPVPAMNVYLSSGVSYDSDLYLVEKVCRDVMDEVLATELGAVKEYGAYFGFDTFGDSNINFWLFLQARDRLGSFSLKTALIQRLHNRFKEEGIVINYPMRSLQLPPEWSLNVLPRQPKDVG